MNKQWPLYLFDIDGTLIREKRSRIGNYIMAVRDVTGLQPKPKLLSTPGRTDIIIVELLCTSVHITANIEITEEILSRYHKYLAQDLEDYPPEAIPGAADFLSLIIEHGVTVGLATGNTRTGAFAKLRAAGLDGFFSVGGFSHSGSNRSEIVKTAVKLCSSQYNHNFHPVLLFGDTPDDIHAAKQNNLLSVAVAGGVFSDQNLAEFNPDLIISSFQQQHNFDKFIIQHGIPDW